MNKILLFVVKLLRMAILASMTAWLWPFYFVGEFIYGHPPVVVRFSQVIRYFGYTWKYARRNKTPIECVWVVLVILDRVILMPIFGVCWFLDEVLYGKELDETNIVAPFFFVSAARSGTTQLTSYLENDPQLVSPCELQCFFPYLWLWRLAPVTIGRLVTKEMVRSKLRSIQPPAYLQRHNSEPFKPDTFEVPFILFRMLFTSFYCDPDIAAVEFGPGRYAPHNQQVWEEDFVKFIDRVGRKTLFHHRHTQHHHDNNNNNNNTNPYRLMIKGHFLCAVPALQRQYPDSRFLATLREPAPRLQSLINFIRVTHPDPMLGPPSWDWLSRALVKTEEEYCKAEQELFSKNPTDAVNGSISNNKMVIIRFKDYCENLETTLNYIYDQCFDGRPVPEEVPKVHAPRERTNYTVNKSLEELNVDVDAFNESLKSYIDWCRLETTD